MENNEDRKGIIFIPLGFNADSMYNVLNIVFCDACCVKEKLPFVSVITFLDTKESESISFRDEKIEIQQFVKKVSEELGDACDEIRIRSISNYATDIPKSIMSAVKEVGKENIIIDLTCGKKDITGSLYTTASISQIENMIYVEVSRKGPDYRKFYELNRDQNEENFDKYTLTKYKSLNEIEKLASLNGMDFIFYKKELQSISDRVDGQQIHSQKIESYCSQLEHVISQYFSDDPGNYKNAIRSLGLISEEIANVLSAALYETFSKDIDERYDEKRSIDYIRKLETRYTSKTTGESEKELLKSFFGCVPTMYEMLETFRLYRNIASHDYEGVFSRDAVKYLLDTMIFEINCIIDAGYAKIWEDSH